MEESEIEKHLSELKPTPIGAFRYDCKQGTVFYRGGILYLYKNGYPEANGFQVYVNTYEDIKKVIVALGIYSEETGGFRMPGMFDGNAE